MSSNLESAHAESAPVRVLIWDEQQPDQKKAYGDKFLGETIAASLAKEKDLSVKTTFLEAPDQGLTDAALDATDVLIWWGHRRHVEVTDANVERIVTRVQAGKLAFLGLHSAHWSKPFVKLMQQRAIADALKQIPEAERDVEKIEYHNSNPFGKLPKPDGPVTPYLEKLPPGVWNLWLPACVFPVVRNDGLPSHVTTVLPDHPIAAGVPKTWDIPQTEVYGGAFHVPKPDAMIFEEQWDKGEHFTSGCAWTVGKGRVFYFRPGHETYPIFQQPEPLRVVLNAVRWLAKMD
jgi:trehalose utilization protein